MSTAGRKLLSSLVYSGDVQAYMKLGLAEHLFKGSEVDLYKYITTHLEAYGVLPSPDTIGASTGFEDSLTIAAEPAQFYLDDLEKRFLHNSLKAAVQEATSFLAEKNGEAAMEALAKSVEQLYMRRDRAHIFDFREAQGIIWETYMQQKKMADQVGLNFGWQSLDAMSGGLRGGDFSIIVGRPSMGKTFMLLKTALHSWQNERTPLFVSMEMNKLIICQRLSAMYSHKNLTTLLKAKMSSSMFDSMMFDLSELDNMKRPFWVVDGNLTTTVQSLLLLCRQLRPSAVFVDGAYLMRHENPRMNKFERISENAELLKQRIATDLDIPVVASYQFNRDASKKKKAVEEKPGLEDVYGSDSMGQLATIALGLLQSESVETLLSRHVSLLKGRNGETGGFDINWDFHNMNFDEILEVKPQELQFSG